MSLFSSQRSALPLLKILETQVLPLWEAGGMERCLIAPTDIQEPAELTRWQATGAGITPAPYRGSRVAVKGPRNYDNQNTNLAYWPEDRLRERVEAAFAFVLGGATDFRVGEHMTHCYPGHSLLILPGVPRPDGSEPHLMPENRLKGMCDILWIAGSEDNNVGCWICHSDRQRHFERPGESCRVFTESGALLFRRFVHEATERRESYQAVCQHLLQSMLLVLCRDIREGRLFQFGYQKTESGQDASIAEKQQDPIKAAQEYIRNHAHQPLQIDDVARHFLLSRSSFTQRFRRETGQTFNEYLTAVRLEEARRLLETTRWSMEIIGKAVGLGPSRLRALFGRYYGQSPQQFRQALHGVDSTEDN